MKEVKGLKPAKVLSALAKEINSAHEASLEIGIKSVEQAIRCGELLVQAKAKQKHGDWLLWFDANVKFSRDTACQYVKLFKSGIDCRNVRNLTAAYKLLSNGKAEAHVSQNSGENEWYTPPVFIDAARAVMGAIDLDPASCDLANDTVRAKKFYSAEDDGLTKTWSGNVWMNPPYAQPLIANFSEKIVAELPNIQQACVLVNNATDTEWFQSMLSESDAVCFTNGRIRFIDKHGKPSGAPLQGQAILYFGDRSQQFSKQFSQFGSVLQAFL